MILLESYGINNPIVLALENEINLDVERSVAKMVENGQEINKNVIDMIVLNLIGKLCKAVAFILPSDKVVEIKKYNQANQIVIDAVVERDGVQYNVNTSAIYASGEVQRLHVRYLVKSELKGGNNGEDVLVKEKIKRLNKIERIDQEIKGNVASMVRCENRIKILENINGDWKKLDAQCPIQKEILERMIDDYIKQLDGERKEYYNELIIKKFNWLIECDLKNIEVRKSEIKKLEQKRMKI